MAWAAERPVIATLEARWFYPGPVPPDVRAWFAGGGRSPLAQPPRVDHYLRLPGEEELGIKLREGRIEVKRRYDDSGGDPWRFAGRAAGHVEAWHKWSFVLDQGFRPAEDYARPPKDWIAVEKERWLCYYNLEARGKAGCALGLARVEAGPGNRLWWTLAFEAWGAEKSLKTALLAVACPVLAEPDAPSLEPASSYGFPRWLLAEGR